MSVIIYAPIDKMEALERDKERLRKHFLAAEVLGPGFDPYPITVEQIMEFSQSNVLYITEIFPAHKGYSAYDGTRRALSYDRALRMLNGEA